MVVGDHTNNGGKVFRRKLLASEELFAKFAVSIRV
jgi:hypothetical protein